MDGLPIRGFLAAACLLAACGARAATETPASIGNSPLYSNEFEGSINPEQFTEKEGHNPTDLMDPYNE